jgi:lyso-ornithine lipid O-acyltransferase
MKLRLRLCYKIFLITLLFVSGLFIAVIIFPALGVLCKPSRAKYQRGALKMAWLTWFSAIVRLHIIKEGEPIDNAGLLVCNHISWLDIIILGRFLPAYFVAKSDILAWPVIGYLAKQAGTIFIHRGDKQQVKATTEKMLWLLKRNSIVIAFPEGTTTKGDTVLSFQYEGDAKKHAPFIGEDAFVPHLIKMLSLERIVVRVVFLSYIYTAGKNRHSVCNEARSMILDCISGKINQQENAS